MAEKTYEFTRDGESPMCGRFIEGREVPTATLPGHVITAWLKDGTIRERESAPAPKAAATPKSVKDKKEVTDDA